MFGHSPELRSEPIPFSSNEPEAEVLIKSDRRFQKGRSMENQTRVTIGACETFNLREQQVSNSNAAHVRMHSHAPDV